jgi:uncharacterized protein YqjF (DUF2071 family)
MMGQQGSIAKAVDSTLPGVFLRAGWYHLAMLNFPADADSLQKHVPAGTELDLWQGQAYLSMVGFKFQDTRVWGLPVPWHRNFEEVNLRTYVRRKDADGWRRGVVFIQEIVQRRMIAFVARRLYNENYVAMPMRHEILMPTRQSPAGSVRYEWFHGECWHSLSASITGEPAALVAGSEEEFITEHYYGYCRQRDGGTMEYRVEHPPWRVWPADEAQFDCDVARVYGAEFLPCLSAAPTSAFVADGSPILVRRGVLVHASR